MLKAIVTVMDENDRIIQDKGLIFETCSKPISLGIAHEFCFQVVTANEEVMSKITSRDDEIPEGDGGTR